MISKISKCIALLDEYLDDCKHENTQNKNIMNGVFQQINNFVPLITPRFKNNVVLLMTNLDVNKLKNDFCGVCQYFVPKQKYKKCLSYYDGWEGIPLRNYNKSVKSDGLQLKSNRNKDIYSMKDTIYMKDLTYIREILNKIKKQYNTEIGVSKIYRLNKHSEIPDHTDHSKKSNYFKKMVRLHIPIITNENVKFCVDHTQYYLEAGNVYFMDVIKRHSVSNNSDIDRIHLVFDVVLTKRLLNIINK